MAEKPEQVSDGGRDDSIDTTKILTPPWHQNILDERRHLADEGKLKFQDWETMFQELRKGLREGMKS